MLTTLVACASTSRSASIPGEPPPASAAQTVRYTLDAAVPGRPQGALAIRGTEAELALDDPRGSSTGTVERGDITRMTFRDHGVLECTDDAVGLTCTCRDDRARQWAGVGALRFERLATRLADR